ncbi:MAG: branched-chain amino acid ABC transporter permease, partial [Candidatus Bathyarchaeia archaeon]
DAAETAGVNAFRCRLIAFVLCAFFPGVGGGLMAFKTFWVTPSGAFNMMYSGESILVTLLGGPGSVFGPIIGSLVYEILKDVLMRYAPGFQMLIFSLLVIVMVLFAPEGVVGYIKDRSKRVSKILR